MSWLWMVLVPWAAAGPLGPGIAVREVSAPSTLLRGISVLSVQDFSGPGGATLAAAVAEGLSDPERERGLGTLGDVAGEALRMGGEAGNSLIANRLGGGFGGKLLGGLAEGAVGMAADKIEGEKLTLEDGLTVQPFETNRTGGDASLAGSISASTSNKSFKKTVQVKDKNGKVVRDGDGKPVTKEVSCQRRTVQVKTAWQVTRGGQSLASGTLSDSPSSTHCAGDKGELRSAKDLTASAVALHTAGLVNELGPAWRSRRLSLKRSPDLRLPMQLVRKQLHADALCLADHIAKVQPDDAVSLFNRGVFLEALGHHDEAIAAYEAALGQDKGLKPAKKARSRAEARKAEVRSMVEAYGLEWSIGAPPLDRCPSLPDGTPRVVKKAKTQLQREGEPPWTWRRASGSFWSRSPEASPP